MLAYRTEGPIAFATLDRAEKLNAMTREFWPDLRETLAGAEADAGGPRARLLRRRALLLGRR